jgi:hypothetical protein
MANPDIPPAVTVDGDDTPWTMYTGLLLLLTGVFAIFEGLITLANDRYRAVVTENAFVFTGTGWGWLNLLLGILLVGAAVALLTWQEWSRLAGVATAGLMTIVQMIYLSISPIWGLIMVLLSILALYGLVVRIRL